MTMRLAGISLAYTVYHFRITRGLGNPLRRCRRPELPQFLLSALWRRERIRMAPRGRWRVPRTYA